MKSRIIITATSDLSTDNRVLKTARSLENAGYEVLMVGRKLENSLNVPGKTEHHRMRLFFNRSALFYAEYNFRLFFLLLQQASDLIISCDTDTLPAAYLASRLGRRKLVFDAHELFPEVPELADRPGTKKIWEWLEDRILPNLSHAYTVCGSIADHYRVKYGLKMGVVRNMPYLKPRKERKLDFGEKKILLYQGAVNMGRGLEQLIEAMVFLPDAILYIIGDGDVKPRLEVLSLELKVDSRVIFHGRVAADELSDWTSSGDLGLCLLENKGLSYYYALPNRIFDYLHAGVPVLSSPFPEIRKIVETYRTGILTDEKDPEKLASIIRDVLRNPPDTSHFEELSNTFCWEEEEKVLLNIVKEAIEE